MEESIKTALFELGKFKLPWQNMVQKELDYCLDVVTEKVSPERLEELNMGLIAVREIDEREALYSSLTELQYKMQHKYLPGKK